MSWPRPEGISFPDRYEHVLPNLAGIIAAIARFEPVNLNVPDADWADTVRSRLLPTLGDLINRVSFRHVATNEPWCRDHGPAFVVNHRQKAVVDWKFNAWGGKYPPWDDDDAVPTRVGELLDLRVFDGPIVMEGGAVDFNGNGVVLTTRDCLLNPNRNGNLHKLDIEGHVLDYYGQEKVCWLSGGIAGDDTDGHVDDLARFVNERTIVVGVEDDAGDDNYDVTRSAAEQCRELTDADGRPFDVVELPMPGRVEIEGERVPATYVNFYFVNGALLVPTYGHDNDAICLKKLQTLLPQRQVVGVDCREVIWGLGAIHCLTQQEPKGPTP